MTLDYEQRYPQYEGGVTADYAIILGPCSPHNLVNCVYNGTNKVGGKPTRDGGVRINCLSLLDNPQTMVQICRVDTETTILYAEW